MRLRHAVPAFVLALALACPPLYAQGRRGGGSHGGGARGGGSHGGSSHAGGSHGGHRGGASYGGSHGSAVARHPSAGMSGGAHYGSRPGYAPRGSVAQQRHPRAGTGYGHAYYGGGGHHGGNGYYGHGHGGHAYYGHGAYRPYYGYRPYYSSYPYYYPYYAYSPYYSSYWPGVSLSVGWGYASSAPYYAGTYVSPGSSVSVYAPDEAAEYEDGGAPYPPVRETGRSAAGPSGRVRLEVRPDDASVYVDDEFRGTAREARILSLPPGRHLIELVRPGFSVERREVTVVIGERQDVLVELVRP